MFLQGRHILFIILLLLGLCQTVTGFILWFGLARGGEQGRGWDGGTATTFWSLPRHTWIDIHRLGSGSTTGHGYNTSHFELEVDCLYDKTLF